MGKDRDFLEDHGSRLEDMVGSVRCMGHNFHSSLDSIVVEADCMDTACRSRRSIVVAGNNSQSIAGSCVKEAVSVFRHFNEEL